MQIHLSFFGSRTALFSVISLLLGAAVLLVSAESVAQPSSEPPSAAPPSSEAVKTIERKSVAAQADADEKRFQSREERAKVKPLDWTATIGKYKPVTASERIGDEKPATVQGAAPDPTADAVARRAFPAEWPALRPGKRTDFVPPRWKGNVKLAGTADVSTQYCEFCNGRPQSTIGKLFTNAGSCSASVIGKNAIVTAAHCCWNQNTRNWIGGWSFAPGFNNNNTPYGLWSWSGAAVLTSFTNGFSRATDVCVINLQPRRIGGQTLPIGFFVGWLGRSWDWGSIQDHHILGYPGNIGNSQTLQLCTSESFSPSGACGGASVLNAGCTMTFGSSGGPWIRNYRSLNFVNSVVSGYDGTTCTGSFGQTMNGPRFTSSNIVPLCTAMSC